MRPRRLRGLWARAAPTLTPEGAAFVRRAREQNGAVKHPERIHRGERNRQATLTEAAVRDILRRLADETATTGAPAGEYGVARKTINGIVRGERWRHVEPPEPRPRPSPAPTPMPPRPDGEK